MRFEPIPEAREITWVCPGAPFIFDVDAVVDAVPDGIAFGVGIAEEFKRIFVMFDSGTEPRLDAIIIDDGVKLSVEIPADVTAGFKGRDKLIWVVYELRDGKPFPLLKGPIRLDGGDLFAGFGA